MRNILLTLNYKGTAYHGWQVQENAVAIQEKVQDAIETVFQKRENLYGCSRTDAGVHANMYCCNFKTEKNMDTDKIQRALNSNLPFDISVYACKDVPPDFHSRYSCKSKEYKYFIWNAKTRNPFEDGLSMHYKYKLDEKMLDAQAKHFIGKYDFSAFCSVGTSIEDSVRTVLDAKVERIGDKVIFTVAADGFLYNMVRIMTGTLLRIAQGKIAKDSIPLVIRSKNRQRAGVTAPACGLYLNQVNYGDEYFERSQKEPQK